MKRMKSTEEIREVLGRDLKATARMELRKPGWLTDYIGRLERRIVELGKELDITTGDIPETEPHIAIAGRHGPDPPLMRFPMNRTITLDFGHKPPQMFQIRKQEDERNPPHLYVWCNRGIWFKPGGASNALKVFPEDS